MQKIYFQQRIEPDLAAVRGVREALSVLLPGCGFGDERINELLLGVSEALVNLLRHASPAADEIDLVLGYTTVGEQWWLDIRDNGGSFDSTESRSATEPRDAMVTERTDVATGDTADGLVQENGRGLALINALFPDCDYRPAEASSLQNCLRFYPGSPQSRLPHVLLVDDDPALLRLLAAYLQAAYRVSCCCSVAEADSLLETETPDLIVSDIEMTDCTGLEFRQQLLLRRSTEGIPFIFLSGHSDEPMLARAGALAIDDYLVKPIGRQQLRQTVSRVLKRVEQLRRGLSQRFDRQLTRMLQPALPQDLLGFHTALRFRTADAGGGDLVICKQTADSCLLVSADLMGHGSQAKFYAHGVAGYLRGLLSQSLSVTGPAALLSQLSAALYLDPVLSTTLATCLVLDIRSDGTVILACGGHPAPLLWRDRCWSEVDVRGTLPGLEAGTRYTEQRIQLAQGERLLIASDGLWEQGSDPASRAQHEEQIRQLLHQQGGAGLQPLADAVIGAFDGSAAGFPNDDVTLVLLEVAE